MAEETPICDFGWKAPPFTLPAIDGKTYSLEALRGKNGTLVMFICNHCPYVKAVIDRIVRDATSCKGLASARSPSPPTTWCTIRRNSFDNMKRFAEAHRFGFPYLYDESQEVARAYDAACTPDFFGFNADLKLQYRGRLDASGREPAGAGVRRELFEAMKEIAATGAGTAPADPVDRLLHQVESVLADCSV